MNPAKYSLNDIIGNTPEILACKEKVKKVAKFNSNVLILGESGVGKELFAHAVHNASQKKDMPFIRINCSAIPENLLESELFGYEEGSFTGAKKGGNMGKFELANGGTIFLDEIGEMPYHMQAKILRVLQEKELERIGGKNIIKLDVRVICATNRNLEEMVKKGKFREDLYYRLNVLQ
jgi:transcriptional regulator with PAS, ATPase and Fis domain